MNKLVIPLLGQRHTVSIAENILFPDNIDIQRCQSNVVNNIYG